MYTNLPKPTDLEKEEVLNIILNEEYGFLPDEPIAINAVEESCDDGFCAGKANLIKIRLECKLKEGDFSFPVYYTRPVNKKGPLPCFVHINFRDLVPDKYQPSEELADNGYAVLSFCYKDVTSDSGDFTDGLAGVIYPDGKRTNTQCGKIGLWAWAAIRVLDYALTLPEIDKEKISVAGHSRLGKTALLAGALDERFYCAFSNDSGCSGAAITRNKQGERVADICKNFPFWFCENYKQYVNNEDNMPFDQHYLIAANYPHKVYVASAAEDLWADPESEYMGCVEASGYYEKRGKTGFVHPDRMPKIGDGFHDGNIGYHLRAGKHYFSREDWQRYIDFLNR